MKQDLLTANKKCSTVVLPGDVWSPIADKIAVPGFIRFPPGAAVLKLGVSAPIPTDWGLWMVWCAMDADGCPRATLGGGAFELAENDNPVGAAVPEAVGLPVKLESWAVLVPNVADGVDGFIYVYIGHSTNCPKLNGVVNPVAAAGTVPTVGLVFPNANAWLVEVGAAVVPNPSVLVAAVVPNPSVLVAAVVPNPSVLVAAVAPNPSVLVAAVAPNANGLVPEVLPSVGAVKPVTPLATGVAAGFCVTNWKLGPVVGSDEVAVLAISPAPCPTIQLYRQLYQIIQNLINKIS